MTANAKDQIQEFTLPFVGREEELQFLWNEYDQMLHAQYRSVWIEAPAGMGKTTLVEEFLKRISAGARHALPLRPWIVHAHLRERSSNSLASFVETLGVTLQTLTETQREKLFSGLTSFYRERARKIVGGGNAQSMDMEEAITTAGYILKQLSKYFPLVVIIEDIHVLKGEMSFYALRHLQAIMEQVPMMMLFVSRPSEEKYLKQFQELSMKEGCKKYKVKSLTYEDVEHLVGAGRPRPAVAEQAKKLMHLSGGNALLLRELLRSGTFDSKDSSAPTTEKIIIYLMKELEQLPKRDRQVIAIAGILGEEFSERLLQEITDSKDFRCWSDDVLRRLEQKGIITRRKKILKPEGGGKEVPLQVSVFTHALWWEAARKLYHREKTWTDRKFAETIIPLLSHQNYPLLTDAELIVKLFQWTKVQTPFALLEYVNSLCSSEARWHFHTEEEMVEILAKAREWIVDLMARKISHFTKRQMESMIGLLAAEKEIMGVKEQTIHIAHENFVLIKKLYSLSLDRNLIFEDILSTTYNECYMLFYHYADENTLKQNEKALKSFQPLALQHHLEPHRQAFLLGMQSCREWYCHPAASAELFYEGAQMFPRSGWSAYNYIGVYLGSIATLSFPQSKAPEYLLLATQFRKEATQADVPTLAMIVPVLAYRAEISLALRVGKITEARERCEELLALKEKVWTIGLRLLIQFAEARVCSVEGDRDNALRVIQDIFSKFSWRDDTTCLKALAKIFLTIEEWGYFEKLWQENKPHLWPRDMPLIIPLMESRLLMCLLLGNDKGVDEVREMLATLRKKYPILKEAIKSLEKKLNLFLTLKTSSLRKAKQEFDKFIDGDNTMGTFDKAHYTYLFARIGVQYNHDPKEFSTYVKNSLEGFIKLNVPKRVVFTAECLAEANLITLKELHQLQKKYAVKIRVPSPNSQTEVRKEFISHKQETTGDGITLHCLGRIRAFDPNGVEIIKKQWGQRQAASHHRHIVAELVRAKKEHRFISRRELLAALYPQVKTASERKIVEYDHLLSVLLYQIKKVFAPYEVFEKNKNGYCLHSSVDVDIFRLDSAINHAKKILTSSSPSAYWLLQKAASTFEQGEFAQDIRTKEILSVRKNLTAMHKEVDLLLEKAGKNLQL